jgi:transcription initiation factor TFIID TATA-box-binding protein
MDSLTTHPSTAAQAKAFTAPGSLSYPSAALELTPPSDKEGGHQANGVSSQANGLPRLAGNANADGNGVNPANPATPAATPSAAPGSVSGIIPTLQ